MHAKSAEVTQFLENNLLPQVREAFSAYQSSDRREIQRQLAKAKEDAVALGVPPGRRAQSAELQSSLKRRPSISTPSKQTCTTTSTASSGATTARATSSATAFTRTVSTPFRTRRGGQASLGQRGPVLHQDQRVLEQLLLPAAPR